MRVFILLYKKLFAIFPRCVDRYGLVCLWAVLCVYLKNIGKYIDLVPCTI